MKRLLFRTLLPSLVAATATLAATTTDALAQSAEHEPAIFELGPSARAAGMGGAFQVGQPDPDVVFYNPAVIARASGFRLGYQRYAETSGSFSLSAATGWWGADVAVGLQTLEYGALEPEEGSGPGKRAGGIDPLVEGGNVGASETAATVAYARDVGPVTAGLGVKLFSQRFGGFRRTRTSLDVGVTTNLGRFWLDLAARNLGSDYYVGSRKVSQPEQVAGGIGTYGYQLGPLDVGAAGRVARRADGEWVGGGGIEVGYYPVTGRTFVVRLGGMNVPEGDLSPFTVGASYWGDDIVLEYAFQPMDGSDGLHRLTLGWR